MTSRKFYKTIVQVEILSEEPIGEPSLETIHYNITDGDWSGVTLIKEQKELDGAEMANELLNQASDSSFFGLTEDGEDVE